MSLIPEIAKGRLNMGSQAQQQHSDMMGVRRSIGDLDKRVSVLEVRQTNTDTHLQELRVAIHEISQELKSLGKDLLSESKNLQHELASHTEREDKDRIEMMRRQRTTTITIILGITLAAIPYVIIFLQGSPFTP
jgi:predicted  nucleic acid-binding Zn-ribbon protein